MLIYRMNLTIRKATKKDLETVKNFTHKLNKSQYDTYDKTINPDFALSSGGEKYLQRALSDDGAIFLAEKQNVPVGFIVATVESVGDFRTINTYCEIDFMWVDDAYRNQNIGTELIKHVEDWCRGRNIKRMRIAVDASNEAALRLYKKQSFKEYDIVLEKNI